MIEGFLIGIGSSFIIWWIVQKYLAPKILFGSTIKINVDNAYPNGKKYVLQFSNAGARQAFDVEIFARLMIDNLRPGSLFKKHIIQLKLHRDRIPLMRNDGRKNYASLDLYNTDDFTTEHFPEIIRESHKNHKLFLEDIMNLGSHAELVLIVMAYDQWSGARKVFVSKSYTWNDIDKGIANKTE